MKPSRCDAASGSIFRLILHYGLSYAHCPLDDDAITDALAMPLERLLRGEVHSLFSISYMTDIRGSQCSNMHYKDAILLATPCIYNH